MGNVGEMIKGFLWGVGFSIALLGVGSAYYLTIAIDVEKSFKDMLRVEVLHSAKEIESYYKLSVIELFKENGAVRVAAQVQNVSNEEIYTHPIIAATFDENGKFIGNCVGTGPELTLSPNEISNIDISCNLFRMQADRVASASLKMNFK